MKKTEVKDAIFSELTKLVADKGFRYSKKESGQLTRQFKGGFQIIYGMITDYCPHFEFELVVEIRLDAAEEIRHAFFDLPPSGRTGSTTVSIDLGYFLDCRLDERFQVSTLDEISKTIKFLTPVLLDKIIPTLDRCTDAQGLDKLINSELEFYAVESLIVARLAGNPNFDRLVREKEEIVAREHDEKYKHCFSRLVEYLKGYDIANPPALPALKQVRTKPEDWPVGLPVKHPEYGLGTVVKTQGRDDALIVKVDFGKAGTHKIAVGICEYEGYGTILEKA